MSLSIKEIESESEYVSSEEDDNFSTSTGENEEDVDEESEKKKRGRKKKEVSVQDEKVQKKRGRKPKNKEVEEVDKVPKKRGRKPKEKIYSVKELPKTFFEENKNETFILHLPIKPNDKNNSNSPLPDDKNNYSIYNEEINDYKLNETNLLPTQLNLMGDDLVFDKYENVDFREDIQNHKASEEEQDDEIKPNRILKKNLRNILYEFINANNDKTWPESTNIYCWWCCHPFNGPPCAVPEYYRKERFYVNGCFCSFNCAASYNFSKNDNNMWERYSLLNLMYKKLFNQKFVKINMAPPREILKIFGGYMSIEEFRETSLKNDKNYKVIKPPLISIIPKIEENISNTNKTLKNNFPLVNENILKKTENNLKLKRNKPVTNPNSTLQSFMDLKII